MPLLQLASCRPSRLASRRMVGALLAVVVTAMAHEAEAPSRRAAASPGTQSPAATPALALPLRVDLVAPSGLRQRTAPAEGWIAYHGERYAPARGYGWIEDLPHNAGGDRGEDATIVLPDGTRSSARLLGRRELAHWQGTHQENVPLVFRVDLLDGWYRVRCTSVDPGTSLPLVEQRGFKCRSNRAVFAGPRYGAPLATSGVTLVEGADMVEVANNQLRVVIGDPAYPGWTWRYPGPWYEGWSRWWGRRNEQRYAENWFQRLARVVDPGFHSLRLNSLEIDRVPAPVRPRTLLFRDLFDRDDASDVNRGVPAVLRWVRRDLTRDSGAVEAALYKTSLTLTATRPSAVAFIQASPSPATGIVRYSTRVSVATGAGSRSGTGVQQAGLLLLGDGHDVRDSRLTFVGVTVAPGGTGGFTIRVGDRAGGYHADVTIPRWQLPFEIAAGEYEIVVDHDIDGRTLRRIVLNGTDVTHLVPATARHQPVEHGVFGIRAVLGPASTSTPLRQSYWVYLVEQV